LGRPLAPEAVATGRMRAERIGPRHLDALAPMLADPRVGATMGGVLDREQVAEQLAELDGKWERDGFGYYMWFDTATGAPVARGGLSRAEFDGRPEVELGWLVTPARWGEGLATEVGAAAVEVAFGPLGLDDVVAFTLPDNVGSRRVMEKLGFVYEKTAPYKVYGDHVLYRRRRGAGDAAR
jgi:ribosomal-protein-alanine N-acetyltransferase